MDAHARRATAARALLAGAAENLGLKITSLLISLALFGMVRGAGNVQRSIEVSLLARLPAPAARRVLLTELPDKIRVTVRGSPSLVGSLRADDLAPVQIDLADGRRAEARLSPALFQLPVGVQIAQVTPDRIELNWDALVEREVPVRAALTGPLAPGARLAGATEVAPATVHVAGPALYTEALTAVRTDPVDVTGLAPGHYERRVALEAPRAHVRYDLGAAGVRVDFTVERELVERRFEHVPVTPVGIARVTLRPPITTVVLRGAPSVVNALDPAAIVPTVDLSDSAAFTRGATRAAVSVQHVPTGATLVSIEPAEVIVVPAR